MGIDPLPPASLSPVTTPIASSASMDVMTTPARSAPLDGARVQGEFRSQSLRLSARIAQLERASIEVHRANDKLDQLESLIDSWESIDHDSPSDQADQVDSLRERVIGLAEAIAKPGQAVQGDPLTSGSLRTLRERFDEQRLALSEHHEQVGAELALTSSLLTGLTSGPKDSGPLDARRAAELLRMELIAGR